MDRKCIVLWFGTVAGATLFSPALLATADPPSLPAYREDAFNRAQTVARRVELESACAAYGKKADVIRARLDAAFGVSCPAVRERTLKRLAIWDSLVRFVALNLARGDVSSVLFAEQGCEDLRKLDGHLEKEIAYGQKNPEAPGVLPTVLRADAFGMRGDGRTDNTAALAEAAKALVRLNGAPAILDIPDGTYRFSTLRRDCWQPSHAAFERLTNVLVRGKSPDSVRFVFTDIGGYGVVFYRCANVTFRGVEVSWDGTLHSEGRVVRIDAADKTLIVEHTAGTMKPDDPRFAQMGMSQACAQFRADGSRVPLAHTITTDPRRPVRDLGVGRFSIPVDVSIMGGCYLNCEIGGFLEIPCRSRTARAVLALDGEIVSFDDIRVLNSPSAGFTGHGSSPSLSRCVIRPKPGMRISTNADGFITDRGSYMAHCDFSGLLDDGHNPHGYGGYIATSDGTNLVYKSRNTYLRPKAGDLLTVMRPASGQFLANVRATADSIWTSWKGEGEYTRTAFAALPPVLHTYANQGGASVSNAEQIQMVLGRAKARPLPDQVYFPDMDGVGGIVSDCRVAHMRGKAFSIQSSNMLVEKVTIEDVYCGIGVCALSDWTEGPLPYNVTIRDCTLRHVEVALKFEHRLCDLGNARTAGLRGVAVTNVALADCGECLSVANVSDGTFENIVATDCRKPGRLESSERVAFQNCRFDGGALDLNNPKVTPKNEER